MLLKKLSLANPSSDSRHQNIIAIKPAPLHPQLYLMISADSLSFLFTVLQRLMKMQLHHRLHLLLQAFNSVHRHPCSQQWKVNSMMWNLNSLNRYQRQSWWVANRRFRSTSPSLKWLAFFVLCQFRNPASFVICHTLHWWHT